MNAQSPAGRKDPVIEAYNRSVDRTLIRENCLPFRFDEDTVRAGLNFTGGIDLPGD